MFSVSKNIQISTNSSKKCSPEQGFEPTSQKLCIIREVRVQILAKFGSNNSILNSNSNQRSGKLQILE